MGVIQKIIIKNTLLIKIKLNKILYFIIKIKYNIIYLH